VNDLASFFILSPIPPPYQPVPIRGWGGGGGWCLFFVFLPGFVFFTPKLTDSSFPPKIFFPCAGGFIHTVGECALYFGLFGGVPVGVPPAMGSPPSVVVFGGAVCADRFFVTDRAVNPPASSL